MGFVKSVAAPESKGEIFSFSTTDEISADWLRRNGYVRLADLWGGSTSHSGKTITPLAALESSAVYAIIKIISEDMGSLPFFAFQRSQDRRRVQKATEHRLWATLKNLWNPDLAAGEGVEALTAHAALLGNGFAEIEVWGRKGEFYLWPMDSELVRIDKTGKGEAVYLVRDSSAAPEREFPKSRIFHLRGFTLNGVSGDRILHRARNVLGLTLSADEFAGRYFANDLSAGLFVEHPGDPGPEGVQNLKKSFREAQGPAHAGEPFVLREGAKASRHDPDLSKMQLVEVRKHQILEACRIWRMPPHKLAQLDQSIKANIEAQSIEYTQHTLKPWVRRWKEAVHRCLLTRDEQIRDRIFAEHDLEAIVRGDFKTQSDGFAKLLEKGVWSINEVRRFLNANPVEGGDSHHIQLNMTEISALAKQILQLSGESEEIEAEEVKELPSEIESRRKRALLSDNRNGNG